MAKFYYNGVLLPEPPSVSGSNYYFIGFNNSSNKYYVYYSPTPWYFDSTNATIDNGTTTKTKLYSCVGGDDSWTYVDTQNYAMVLDSNRELIWTSHDLPNGSTTSTDIYFYTSEPSSEPTISDEFYGIESLGTLSTLTTHREAGYTFTVNTDITMTGFRLYTPVAVVNVTCRLWSSDKTVIASATVSQTEIDNWVEIYLDNPIDLISGQTYTISCWIASDRYCCPTSSVTTSSSITITTGCYETSEGIFPSTTGTNIYQIIDITYRFPNESDETLKILAPPEYTFDFTNTNWKTLYPDSYTVTDSPSPFYTASTFTYNGQNTLRSKSISHSGTSSTTINFTILDNTASIEFNYKVSSEGNYDWLTITLDGTQVVRVSGTVDWTVFSQELNVGSHTLELKYTKDGSKSAGSDAGAIGYLKIIGMSIPFDKKYLIRCNSTLYTVVDSNLTPLEASYPSAEVFRTYGFDETPEWNLISTLTNPEILYWYDTTDVAPELAVNMTAVPLSQNIITNAIDLSDPTITGIELMTVNCEGNPLFAVSFDDKATWYAWNGTEWSLVSEEFSGMTKELLESVTYDQWMLLYEGASSFYIRVSLATLEDKLTEIYVDFAN